MSHRGILGAVAAAALISAAGIARDAHACGGCFPPVQSGTVVTDHRMIFSVSTQQTTLYDEIKYSGSPASFAWVLPIRSQVTLGVSSDILFASLEQATKTTIIAPPRPTCPACLCGGRGGGATADAAAAASDAGSPVIVLAEQTVGPYDTVQLQSTDPNALNNWLSANGFVIPADVQSVIAAYVMEGFDFLALKLAPGQGIQSMQPVRVTTPGAGLSLPLRMVAAGTGAIVGITLWVVADGRYEPQNFPFFAISASELTWDWSASRSTYTTVQVQKEAATNNSAWQIESSLVLSPFQIENPILVGDAGANYPPPPASDSGATEGGAGTSAADLQQQDLATLFPGGSVAVRVTRMRSDLAHSALATDLVLQASTDQSTLSNIYQVTQSVNAPQCPACPCADAGGSGSSSSSSGASSSGSTGSSGVNPGSGASSSGSGGGPSSSSGSGGGSTSSGPGGAGEPDDGGASASGAHGSSGCAATTAEPNAAAAQLVAAGFLAIALGRARRKRS